MEELIKSELESNGARLEEITERARQDALKYLEERMRLNLFERKKVKRVNPKKQVLKENAFPIMEKTFAELNIMAGSYEQKYYLEQFAITAGLDNPKN